MAARRRRRHSSTPAPLATRATSAQGRVQTASGRLHGQGMDTPPTEVVRAAKHSHSLHAVQTRLHPVPGAPACAQTKRSESRAGARAARQRATHTPGRQQGRPPDAGARPARRSGVAPPLAPRAPSLRSAGATDSCALGLNGSARAHARSGGAGAHLNPTAISKKPQQHCRSGCSASCGQNRALVLTCAHTRRRASVGPSHRAPAPRPRARQGTMQHTMSPVRAPDAAHGWGVQPPGSRDPEECPHHGAATNQRRFRETQMGGWL